MVPEDLAAQFRERVGKVGAGGVVVLFDGVCCSWVNCLRNPEHWRIGALAVAEDGRKWKAVGRVRANGDDAASVWSELMPESRK
jgi:hypothetical protein